MDPDFDDRVKSFDDAFKASPSKRSWDLRDVTSDAPWNHLGALIQIEPTIHQRRLVWVGKTSASSSATTGNGTWSGLKSRWNDKYKFGLMQWICVVLVRFDDNKNNVSGAMEDELLQFAKTLKINRPRIEVCNVRDAGAGRASSDSYCMVYIAWADVPVLGPLEMRQDVTTMVKTLRDRIFPRKVIKVEKKK